MPPVKRALVICTAALVLTACGGGGAAKTYAAAPTRQCLAAKNLPVSHNVDFVASTALGGSFAVTLPDNSVTVSFGSTVPEGDNIDQAYRRFRAKNVGIDDVLRQQGNAVMLWHVHPSDADLATVTGCLKGS